ncbi:MAG: NAD(P)-dependent oxidoreductase [Proteobacteria bacterium]|nr:NAD(P)-dependent oxidoreductase [Pseudomonadota bacterium]
MKLGFIGLGEMGRPLAGHLLRGGHQLTVWARRPAAAATLVAEGALWCDTPAEMARRCEIVFTMLTAGEDVKAVALGAEGLAHGCVAGRPHFSVLVDMSTIGAAMTRLLADQLAEHAVAMLDAPVSGGVAGAQNASLAIMVGGSTEILARVRPLFDLLGKTVVHVGAQGAGQVAKACNQMVMVAAIQACAEAMQLAAASGVDLARVREALMGGSAGSKVLEVFGGRMVARDFQAGVAARLHHKDFGILLSEAQSLACPLPIAAQVAQQLNALMGHGWGTQDTSSLLRVLEAATAK